jgi:hypothetical protein
MKVGKQFRLDAACKDSEGEQDKIDYTYIVKSYVENQIMKKGLCFIYT